MSVVAIFFYTVSELLLISSFLAFIYGYKQIPQGASLVLIGLLLASVVADSLGSINMYYYLATDVILINYDYSVIYRIIEFVLCLLYFKNLISLKLKPFVLLAVILTIPYFFLFKKQFISLINYNSDVHVYNIFLFTIFSIVYLIHYYVKLETNNPLKDSNFWYVSGLLICFSGASLISVSFQSLVGTSSSAAFILYSFKNIFMIARNILFIKGFHCHKLAAYE